MTGAPVQRLATGQKPPTPPAGAEPSNDVAHLNAQLLKLRKRSYFEVLNLTREADSAQAKLAYFKLAKSYHPDTVPPGSPEALAKVKGELFTLITDAHRTLSDPKLKQEYIDELDSGTQGEKVDVARLLLAEELFQRGRMLVKARKWAEAVKVLDEAIAANAQEGEYFGWRGFSRFFLYEDKAQGHALALKDIEYALKLNPNAAATYYFHGYLWKLMGDQARAKPYFKRCVELDPRHIDAQRELRIMK
jgi:curved DNA-binding protein CbpA